MSLPYLKLMEEKLWKSIRLVSMTKIWNSWNKSTKYWCHGQAHDIWNAPNDSKKLQWMAHKHQHLQGEDKKEATRTKDIKSTWTRWSASQTTKGTGSPTFWTIRVDLSTISRAKKGPKRLEKGRNHGHLEERNRRTAGNYRPVSLTCILCKIMEALVREDIITHMRENKLFSKYQYGFINKRSTTLQLLYVLDEWTAILDQGGTIDAVYLDFMKAFDKVPHKRHKLSAYWIGGQAHRWIASFLTGRTQRVKVDSATSGWRKVTSGISQGSVLGPILFVLYINDMPEALANNSTAAMFADDTKLYRRTDLPTGVQDLQEDLDHNFQWSDTWLMKFQPTRCKVMSLGYQKDGDIPTLYLYTRKEDGRLEKVDLENTEVEKDIGVYVDKNLNFQEQIPNKTNKANQIMGIIRRTFDHLDHKSFSLLYKSLVWPHLELTISAWVPHL